MSTQVFNDKLLLKGAVQFVNNDVRFVGDADSKYAVFSPSLLTTAQTYNLPDATGALVLDTQAERSATAVTDNGSAFTLTPANGPVQAWTPTAAASITVTVSGFDAAEFGAITLLVTDATLATGITFPGGFWYGDAPTLTDDMVIEIVSDVGSTTGRGVALDGSALGVTAAGIRTLGFFDITNDGTGSGLDADLLDGNEATAFATAAQGALADTALQSVEGTAVLSTGEGGGTKFLREDGDGTCSWQTIAGGGDVSDGDTLSTGLTFPNEGLHILDTNASHDLVLKAGSDLTADRILTVTTGDAARTLTLSGDTTLSGGSHSGTNTGDQTITLTGDVTGTGTGSFAATIASDSVTYDKMQDTSGTDVLLGRSTAGAGTVEEVSCTAAGRALLDDASASAQRTTLEIADNHHILTGQTVSVGSVGDVVYLSGANTWALADADAVATSKGLLGIKLSATEVQIGGIYTTTGLTAAAEYWLSTTEGGITTTKPSVTPDVVRLVGYAISTTQLLFRPDATYIEL